MPEVVVDVVMYCMLIITTWVHNDWLKDADYNATVQKKKDTKKKSSLKKQV